MGIESEVLTMRRLKDLETTDRAEENQYFYLSMDAGASLEGIVHCNSFTHIVLGNMETVLETRTMLIVR